MKVRVVTGGIIVIHGLLRIIFIEKYIDFVITNFVDVIPAENLLTIGSAILPFIEFFAGLLILTNTSLKKALVFAGSISVFMVIFILVGSLYERIAYHALIMVLMAIVYYLHRESFEQDRTLTTRKRLI